MAKVQREKVVIESSYYNFDERYEEEMKQFDDMKVISISLVYSKKTGDSIREEYLVFYEELLEETDECLVEAGDFVYWNDGNTGEKIYETVEKVVFDDGIDKCYFVEPDGGFLALEDVVLIVKKKDRKDV